MNIYHPRSENSKMGKTIRINLKAVKELLDRKDIRHFSDLKKKDRELLQRRVDEYSKNRRPIMLGYVPAKLIISNLYLELILGRCIRSVREIRKADRRILYDVIPNLKDSTDLSLLDFEITISYDISTFQIIEESPPVIDQFPDKESVKKAIKIQ